MITKKLKKSIKKRPQIALSFFYLPGIAMTLSYWVYYFFNLKVRRCSIGSIDKISKLYFFPISKISFFENQTRKYGIIPEFFY